MIRAIVVYRFHEKKIYFFMKLKVLIFLIFLGDSFVGSMSYYLAYHPELDMTEMIRRSCDIASISVQKEGTQTSFPYRKNLSSDKFF